MNASELAVYLVLDPDLCGGLDGMLRVTTAAVAGGVRMVQLRAPDWKKRRWLDAARALLPLCHAGGARLLINDHLDVALLAHADGVHLGQQDLPVDEARRWLGPDALIGLSANRPDQLLGLPAGCVDYLGVGPVFPTTTKKDADAPCGLNGLAAMVRACDLPVVGIGGIHATNAGAVWATGVAGVAVVSALCACSDPRAEVRRLREIG